MSRTLWRIASSGEGYSADDLSGNGSAKRPGRWNAKDQRVIYCAPQLAVAILETTAHVDSHGLPLNRYVVELLVSNDDWHERTRYTNANLPADWDAIPAGHTSISLGREWYKARETLLLEVPSVIVPGNLVPEESCVLINCDHPNIAHVTATVHQKFQYNCVLR